MLNPPSLPGNLSLRRAVRKLRARLAGTLLVDRGDYRETVLLAGSARSGTTWISNVINYDDAYRYMFEPFNSRYVEAVSHFRYRQYLREDNRQPAYVEPAHAILSGRIRHSRIDKYNVRIRARRRIIKEVHANHLLKWIDMHFPEIPIILVLRHPCAVACSRIQLGWDATLDDFLDQPALMNDYLVPFEAAIREIHAPFERQIVMWCIENYVPLKQFARGGLHLAFYEQFCTAPEDEVGRLFAFLERSFTPRVYKTLRRPSRLSRVESPIRTGANLVKSWRVHVRDDQIERAVDILSLFGLDALYAQAALPQLSGPRNPFAKD